MRPQSCFMVTTKFSLPNPASGTVPWGWWSHLWKVKTLRFLWASVCIFKSAVSLISTVGTITQMIHRQGWNERIRQKSSQRSIQSLNFTDFSLIPPNSPQRRLRHREMNDLPKVRAGKGRAFQTCGLNHMRCCCQRASWVSLLGWTPETPKLESWIDQFTMVGGQPSAFGAQRRALSPRGGLEEVTSDLRLLKIHFKNKIYRCAYFNF